MQRGGLRRGLGKELVASPAAGFRKPLLAARHKSRPPPLHARALPGRAAAVLGQAAIAAGIITPGGRSLGSRLRQPVAAQPQ